MKKLIALTFVALGIAASARAQWTVYDPAVHSQQIISTAQEIAKFVEMINNQVQQICSEDGNREDRCRGASSPAFSLVLLPL